MQKNILLLNGPNLNMLGVREPERYGGQSLESIEADLYKIATEATINLECFQTNSEEAMLNKIHQSLANIDFILINPGAWTHTSIALRDAILAVNIPFIEIHISNIYAREPFRHHSYLSDIAQGVICGFGVDGYKYALQCSINILHDRCIS